MNASSALSSSTSSRALSAEFSARNNAGEGFDPSGEIDGWALVFGAATTDDVAVYRDGDDAVLVGTDGSGDEDSRWAVRIAGITDEAIEALRTSAAESGDLAQSGLCTIALGYDRALTGAEKEALYAADWDHLATHPATARAACARVLDV